MCLCLIVLDAHVPGVHTPTCFLERTSNFGLDFVELHRLRYSYLPQGSVSLFIPSISFLRTYRFRHSFGEEIVIRGLVSLCYPLYILALLVFSASGTNISSLSALSKMVSRLNVQFFNISYIGSTNTSTRGRIEHKSY